MEVHENANTVNVYEFRKKKATIVMVAFFTKNIEKKEAYRYNKKIKRRKK